MFIRENLWLIIRLMSMIIGISGGTGSGKTTVANRILESVSASEVVFIQQDSYYRNLTDLPLDFRGIANFDHPDALDNELLVNHVRRLKSGEAIELPLYDFKTNSRLNETRTVEPKPIVIVEGILIFADPRLLEQMDIKVFVDTPDDIGFIRRLRRDIAERGRTIESVIEQYLGTVRPMHMQFVEPSKRHADVIIPEGGHPTDVVVERQAAEALADLVRRALAQVGDEVRSVGRAAAVAEDEDLPVLGQRGAVAVDEARDGVLGDGVQRLLLLLEVPADPVGDGAGGADSAGSAGGAVTFGAGGHETSSGASGGHPFGAVILMQPRRGL